MAFGFGFNKQKALSAAEKFVQQGKLQNAIAEYDKILKNDAKDLTVNNTIGDLYARLGDTSKAIECFKMVGDAYAAQGFTVKGIAMYKKITKLQPSVDGSLKLAELYTQQGLFNDARAQYLQVAEDFMKNGELEQAVRLFQKVLEMDPENVPMRVKLAEVYVKLGKKKEAWEIFSAAAEALRARGAAAGAEEILKRMQALDPGNGYVLLLRGRAALEAEDPKSAIGYLEKAPDLDSHPDGLRDLLRAYLLLGEVGKAAPIAEKLLSVHNDPEGLFLLGEGCARVGEYHQALEMYTRHADRLLATDATKLLSSLHTMITHVRDDSGALDSLLLLLSKAGESTHVNEVTELLAHSSVKDGNLSRARDLYQMLSTTEPQNQLHLQNYQQVLGRLDGAASASGITPEEGAVIIEELEAMAPVIDQSYPDAVAIAVRAAVTDADLFLSYNLPDKAVVPLLGVLPQAPRDARLNQRLAALHTRFQRFTEAAVCCRTLESVYHDAGYPDEAVRYGELAARYEETAGRVPTVVEAAASAAAASAGTASKAVAAKADVSAAPWPKVKPPADEPESFEITPPEFSVEELAVLAPHDGADQASAEDLSSEWEDSLAVDDPTSSTNIAQADVPAPVEVEGAADAGVHGSDADNPEIAETVEEIQFYLEHFMTDQAQAGIEKLEHLTSDAGILNPLRAALHANGRPAASPEPEIAEINADELTEEAAKYAAEPAGFEVGAEVPDGSDIPTSPDLLSGYEPQAPGVFHRAAPEETSPDLVETEFALADPQAEAGQEEWADSEAVHDEPAFAEAGHVEAPAPAHGASELNAIVADLEAALGNSFPEAPVSTVREAPRSLPGWPVAKEPKRAAATFGLEVPASSPAPAMAASATASPAGGASTGAAAAAAPAISYGPSSVRPLGTEAQPLHTSDSVDLSEMFGELKQELEEEVAAGDDDPETHYNLGVAFREMGLLDEAIAELQKVCTSIDRGQPFAQLVQTYTWLAQCFLDKGVPAAAIRWYEKALTIPGLDDEARVAINYELGSACETAQDKAAALRHFTSVYGTNIDYRDVAERIQALKS
jgi:tetratricopeptide (TPR) repeat protein